MEIYIDKTKLLTDKDVPTNYWNLIDNSADFSKIAAGFGTPSDKRTPNGNVAMSKDTGWNYPQLSSQVEADTVYTFSYQLYIPQNFNGSMQLFGDNNYAIVNNGYIDLNTIAANQWIRNYCVFLSKVTGKIDLGLSVNTNGLCYFGDYMLNKGTVALDWNYSLNDLRSRLGGVKPSYRLCVTSLKEVA